MRPANREKFGFLMKNTLLFTIANFSNKLIIFFLLPFYTAFLTTEEYAIIDIISITQQLIFPIITLDITEAVIRFGMEKESNKQSIFTVGLILTIVGNIVLAIGCTTGIALSIGSKKYILYFLIFSVVISFNTLMSSFLRTIDKVHVITIASIVNILVATLLNIILIAKEGLGVDGYYLAFIIGNLFAIFIMIAGASKVKYSIKVNRNEFKHYCIPMVKYAMPLIPNALFWWVNSSLDRYFLTAMSGLAYAGMYAAANKIPSILSTVTSIFQQSWGLSMFKENTSESKKEFFDVVYTFYNELLFFTSLFLVFGTKIICSVLLSKEFFTAWTWVPWLVLGFYSNSISSFIGTEFTAAKRTAWILITTLVSAAANTILNILLIPRYSGLGAAIATCISYLILLEIRVIIINRYFELEINNKKLIKMHFVLLTAVISVTILSNIKCLFMFAVCVLVSILIERKELKTIFAIIKQIVNVRKRR